MAGVSPANQRRREPPALRSVTVVSTERLTPRMTRVGFSGDDLTGLVPNLPAGSVRLLVPSSGSDDLVIPQWNGNEFLLPSGVRPALRTFTPLTDGRSSDEMAVDVVGHEGGVVSEWARQARPGDPAALSGPGRGYAFDPEAEQYLIVGDESALPAMSQLIEALPLAARLAIHVELRHVDARVEMPSRPHLSINWHDLLPGGVPGTTLIAAVGAAALVPGTRVWAAGEAASMQALRRHLFEQRGLPRSHVTVRGYWKQR